MNFKLKHKNVIAKGLISTLVLAGLVGAGYGVGQYVNNNSAHAIGLNTGSDDFYRHSAAGVEVQDYFGPFSLNGKWVWCIEPTRTTNTGADYTSRGDVMTANYTVRRFDVYSQTFVSEVSPDLMSRTVAAVFPYVMLEMPMDQVESLLRERGVADAENMINVVRSIRTTPDWARFTTIQLIFWQFTGSGFQSPTRISVGAGPNAEYKTNYVNQLLGLNTAGLQASSGSGTNQDWLMHWYHRIIQEIDIAVNYNKSWEYTGGAELWYSGTLQRLVSGSSGRIDRAKGYLKATKEFSNLTQDLNTKPSWDPNGIKIGVYKNSDASGQQVGILTIDANGHSNTLKVKPDKYYGFELDVNGNPIKSVASEVVNGTAANRGYVSGSDKKDTSKPYIVWDVKAENTESNPDVQTFVNTPEVVNFTFSKEIAADSIKSLEAIDPQYTRVGAVYTLYKDADATQPVTRNGQNVTATIGADGTAEFSNLYRGVYYVKETAVPTFVKNGRTVKRFALDKKVYKVDLSTMNDNETNTSDSTVTATKEFKQVGSFVSLEDVLPSSGSLVIKKKDADTKSNTAQGQATLQGAEFKVEFYEMTTLGTNAPVKKWETVYKTDANGEIDVRNRNLMVSTTNADAMNKLFTAYEQAKEWGAYDYRVTETKAPNGYKLGTPQTKDFVVNVKADFSWAYDDASIYNDDLEIELIKTQRPSGDWLTVEDAKKVVIKNATFELTNIDTNDKFTATTDDNGKLKYNGIIAGNYTLREVSADKYITNGQVINLIVAQKDGTTKLVASSQSVPTEENGAFNVTEMVTDKDILVEFENTAAPAKVKLVKANEKGAKLEGAKFKFVHYSADGLTKLGETELTTNAKGELNLEELVIGDWYTVEETKAPQGYKLPAERSVLRFRAEAIPAKDSYAISYWTSTINKTSESNQEAVTSTIKKISTEGTVQDGIKFDADEAKGTMAIEFDFVNNTWKQLPATGSNFGMIVGVVAFAIVIGSTVFYVKRREA